MPWTVPDSLNADKKHVSEANHRSKMLENAIQAQRASLSNPQARDILLIAENASVVGVQTEELEKAVYRLVQSIPEKNFLSRILPARASLRLIHVARFAHTDQIIQILARLVSKGKAPVPLKDMMKQLVSHIAVQEQAYVTMAKNLSRDLGKNNVEERDIDSSSFDALLDASDAARDSAISMYQTFKEVVPKAA